MNLLLDTHIAIWAVHDSERLSGEERRLIEDADSVSVSAITIWEIAIKFALPKGRPNDMPFSGHEARRLFAAAGLLLLPVTPDHAAAVDDLLPLHGDPFDRMLVAQALTEPLHFLTRDARLKDYGSFVKLV